MENLKLTYSEAYQLVNDLIKDEGKLAPFCRKHNIAYQQFLGFRHKPKIQRITMLAKLLKVFGYKINKTEKVVYFHITKPKTK